MSQILRDIQISTALKNVTGYSTSINASATFTKTGSHILTASPPKGVEYDQTISISTGIVEKYDNFTFKFNTPGLYRIDYRVTAFINQNNTVADLIIRPSVSDNLTDNGEFLNITDFGIITTRKTVQTSSNADKVYQAVDSIYDSCV